MSKKVIFFDIDGTLINFGGEFPESAKEALRLAKANGHKIILCTGRSICQIEERLLEFGFDGFVSAAGANVTYGGKEIFANHMTEAQLSKLLDFMKSQEMIYMLQCTDKVVGTSECFEAMHENFKKRLKGKVPKNISQIFEHEYVDDDLINNAGKYKNAEKICYYKAGLSLWQIKEMLGEDYYITAMSFKNENESSGEIAVGGITKAVGMEKLVEYLGITREDTVAFGDGPNDFEMIEYAGIGVAMGNASDDLKAIADFVTTNITEDGIYNGMKELNLI